MYNRPFNGGGSRPGGRPPFRGNGGGSSFRPRFGGGGRGGSRGGGNRFQGARIDVSKFINKAVITEEVDVFVPEHAFADFKIDERLKKNIISKGYVTPTPIQDRAIPHVIAGADVVGIANTGTGKTAAFLIPILNKIMATPREKAIIIVPTRELAIQIEKELINFRGSLPIWSVTCVGGAHIGRQITGLRRNPNIVIGTPGRLKDLIERRALYLGDVATIVLDEADRMLDMGFVHDMRYVMGLMPAKRQTLFFSATLSNEIERLIGDFLKNPVKISVKTRDTSKTIDQDVVRVPDPSKKVDVLHDLLADKAFTKVLVFGRTKHGVEKLSKMLEQRGFKADSIHGNKSQSHRQRALEAFRSGQAQVLVATDVAARGLDIANVSHVINFDLPGSYEDYVHRIGRTGRGGKKGTALTFIEGNHR
jgi:superfamily II DNA/RNA helicase